MTRSTSTSVLAIIGGGRWGQVILSIAAKMQTSFDCIVIVSQINVLEVRNKIAELNVISLVPLEIVSTIDELLFKYEVKAAVVVNAAKQHFETAHRLIRQGIHVLIEKPIVLSLKQMQILIQEAEARCVILVPGLSYRFCSYIKNFSFEVEKKGTPTQFFLKWVDTNNEMRYGQQKRHDTSISVVQDVMPHVWTIFSIIFPHSKMHIHTRTQNSDHAILKLSINTIKGSIVLERNGVERERYLSLQFGSESLALDFTQEPGKMQMDSKILSGDPYWAHKASPLTQQLTYFFSAMESGKSNQEDFQYCLDSVSCVELASDER